MAEIDLIPQSYRNHLWQRAWLQTSGMLLAAIIIAGVGARVSLSGAVATVNGDLKSLQDQKAVVMQQQAQIDQLTQRHTESLRQLSLLRGLRSGVAARNLFTAIDDALASGDVWFLNWQFRRSDMPIPEQRTVNTGYFVVVPEGSGRNNGAWQNQTHMKIRGQASDHAALSRFVQGLLAERDIYQVHVQKTSQRDYTNTTVVDFDLAVVLNDGVGGS